MSGISGLRSVSVCGPVLSFFEIVEVGGQLVKFILGFHFRNVLYWLIFNEFFRPMLFKVENMCLYFFYYNDMKL